MEKETVYILIGRHNDDVIVGAWNTLEGLDTAMIQADEIKDVEWRKISMEGSKIVEVSCHEDGEWEIVWP